MGILENIADLMQAKKKSSGKSVAILSEELEISPPTLQDYLKAASNPTIKIVEHLAEKLDLDPIALMAGIVEPKQYETVLLLTDTIRTVSDLPQDRRLRFAELFLEMVQLWEDGI